MQGAAPARRPRCAARKNDGFAALAAHPNIEVRMFNPFRARAAASLRNAGEAHCSFGRINRRMHNKSWIADNRIAIVGGRNIGDEYFGAGDEVNFVDLDFAMLGPVVRDVSASFDKYWNSPSAYPMETLDPRGASSDERSRSCARAGRRARRRAEDEPLRGRAARRATSSSGCSGRLADAVVGRVRVRVGRPARRSTMKKKDVERTLGRRRAAADGRRRAVEVLDHLAVLRAGRRGDGGLVRAGAAAARRSAC